MKNFIIPRNIGSLILALGIGLLASCDENIHDFVKKTGSDAAHAVYIADSIFSFLVSTSVNGENLGIDTIVAKFPVCLSQAAEADVKATIAVDDDLIAVYNARHGKSYLKLPNSKLTRSTVTIKKGQTQSSDSMIISYPQSPGTLSDTKGYLLPVKIFSYGGSDVKINYEERVAYLVVDVTQQNGIYFKNTENTGRITNNPILGIFNDLNGMKFKLSSLYAAAGETKVVLSVNNSLIPDINSSSQTDFQAVPESDFEPVEITFPAGAEFVEGALSYKGDISTLTSMKGYVIPLEIKSVTGAGIDKVNARRVFYAVVANSDFHSDYVDSEDELGTKVTDRSKYKVVKLVDESGKDWLATFAAPPYPTAFPNGYANEIFKDTNTGVMLTGLNGKHVDMTIDLGEEIQNIAGTRLSFYVAGNSTTAVDVYYATGAEYATGLSNLAGRIDRGEQTQNMYVKFSAPVTARYIRFDITPVGNGAVRPSQFFIYLNP